VDQVVESLLDRKVELIQRGGSMKREQTLAGIGVDRCGSEWRVELFKQFQVDNAEAISRLGELVTAGSGDLFDPLLGAEFGKIITKRVPLVFLRATAQDMQEARVEIGGGELAGQYMAECY
jgi:hypothetical protein